MSARQRKRRVKTLRRRRKVLALAEALPCPEGFIKRVQEFDFGTQFAIALERKSDGLRHAVRFRSNDRWKWMDDYPEFAIARLLEWFEARP